MKKWEAGLVLMVLVFVSLFYFQQQLLVTGDLGRHIINGKVIVEQKRIPTTNLYSYTQTNYPTVYHHWLAGVMFYLVHENFGFEGLTLMDAGAKLVALVIMLFIAIKKSGVKPALMWLMLALPLITCRREIRPELWSYLLLCIYFLILNWFDRDKKIGKITIWLLPLLQVWWVNAHVYFVLGLLTVVVYGLTMWIAGKKSQKLKQLIAVGLLMVIGSNFNPSGWKLWQELVNLSGKLPYGVVEGQSALTVFKALGSFEYVQIVILGVAGLGMIAAIEKKKVSQFKGLGMRIKKLVRFDYLMLLIFWVLGMYQIRFIYLFGYLAIIFMPSIWNRWWELKKNRPLSKDKWELLIVSSLMAGGLLIKGNYYHTWADNLGLGLMPPVKKIEEYFDNNKLAGPVFNNYNIGGYLIYRGYPQTKVFVDNRPEAYPNDFFDDIYSAAWRDDGVWQSLDRQIRFASIVVTKIDNSPLLLEFIKRRLADKKWQVDYADSAIVVLKRVE